MPPADGGPQEMELDDYVRAFEAAYRGEAPVDLRAFLPPVDHKLYGRVLCELVRVDLEQNWARAVPRPLADYHIAFPELFRNRDYLHAITFEDYRLRCQAGEQVNPADYEHRFGVETANWPKCFTAVPASEPIDTEPAITEWLTKAMNKMPRAGDEFLGFQLLVELSSGAFSRVFLSCQRELASRIVVLKIMPRILGESRTLARLQHSNIMPIHSVHETDVLEAVCMPFLGMTTLADVARDLRTLSALPESGKYLMDNIRAGRTLETITRERPVPLGDTIHATDPYDAFATMPYVDSVFWIGTRLADGLAHAHGRGIVHRDLKPANILLTDHGVPMLMDFNLSKDKKLNDSVSAAVVGGTLRYMAPEQLQAFREGVRRGDERSDIYSFGIILYELLTARYPVEPIQGTLPERSEAIVENYRHPAPVRRWNRAVSRGAEALILRCLEPDPSNRYQSARELIEDLLRQLRHSQLKYHSEPTLTDRLRNWVFRHPRLSFAAAIAPVVIAFTRALMLRFSDLDFWQ